MAKYYLAIDINASSGHHILGYLEDGKLKLEEIHRFDHVIHEKDGELCWDINYLFSEIKVGLRKCREIGKLPIFVGIDTWGTDFVLLDREGKVIGNAVDNYQLMAIKEEHPDYLEKAETLLMIPDYLNYLLTGRKRCEYFNATSSQLINSVTKTWDDELIRLSGYPLNIFPPISMPGTILGNLTLEVNEEIGYDCIIVLSANHDTGSAINEVAMTNTKPIHKTVYTGSAEDAATWNLVVLMIASHDFLNLQAARECVMNSFERKEQVQSAEANPDR